MLAFMCGRRGVGRLAFALVGASVIGAATGQTPPSDPGKPSEPAAPVAPKGPPKLETRFSAMFDAIKSKLPGENWELQQKAMTPKEISKAIGDDLGKEGKAIVANMLDGEALGGNNYFDKQMIVVMALRFKDQESAVKYMEMVHKVTKERFEALGKSTPGATMEIKDENLMVIGTNGSRRLTVKNDSGPRAGSTFVNRFIKGTTFVEVMIVAKDAAKSVDMLVTDAALASVGKS